MARVRQELALAPEYLVVTLVAQMTPWKRHALFLEAAANCAREYTFLPFLVIGGHAWGEARQYEQELRAQAEAPELTPCLHFLGTRNDVPALLALSNMLVLPGEGEIFGRVVMEAWQVGVPVTVCDDGAPAERLAHGSSGLVFRSGSAASLAEAILRLARDADLRRKLGEAGKIAAAEFTMERVAAAVLQVYACALSPEISAVEKK